MSDVEIALKYLDEHCDCDMEAGYGCPHCSIFETIKDLKAQLKREMAAVDFYASRDNYDFCSKHERSRVVERDMEDNVFDDLNDERFKGVRVGGKLARETVKARTE